MAIFESGVRFLWALLAFASTIHGQAAPPDLINDFCSLSTHMMAFDGDMLYIAGGWMLYEAKTDYNGRNTVLRSLNISKSFQTSLESVNYIREEPLPDWVPGMASAAWWPTRENTLDLAFGLYRMENPKYFGQSKLPDEDRRWSYNTQTRNWTEEGITLQGWSQKNRSMRVASGMTSWIPKLKRGYMFGGAFNLVTSTTVQEGIYEHGGLIVYDSVANTWTNSSTPVRPVTEGGLVHLTTATDEVLIQFGGRAERATVMEPLSEIHIYSTNQSKWFTHSLGSGVVPTPRFAFCTAVKSAPDGSSHQIYMFGGVEAKSSSSSVLGGPTATSLWVLTIPTFEWVQLPFTAVSTAADPGGRISPSCTAIGEHYIFYYGGRHTKSYFEIPLECDKKANAAFLFDLNTLNWTDQFVPNQGRYEIPERVYNVIGGNKDGGATRMTPTNGFKDASLSTILSFAITSPTGAATSSPMPGPPSKNSTPIAAIVGGTIGGVVAIALFATGAMLFYRDSRRPPEDDELPKEAILLGDEYPDWGGPRPPVYPLELDGEREILELQVHPQELDGERMADMVELPSHEAAREGPSCA